MTPGPEILTQDFCTTNQEYEPFSCHMAVVSWALLIMVLLLLCGVCF